MYIYTHMYERTYTHIHTHTHLCLLKALSKQHEMHKKLPTTTEKRCSSYPSRSAPACPNSKQGLLTWVPTLLAAVPLSKWSFQQGASTSLEKLGIPDERSTTRVNGLDCIAGTEGGSSGVGGATVTFGAISIRTS